MANGKGMNFISPGSYIRQKARTLPIVDCWINADWVLTRLANISVVRRHSNGNYTAGIYLVDLYCQGVKNTFYALNMSEVTYRNFCEKFELQGGFKKISYELAHNIIYAGLEFAEGYGLKPHKDFSITKYILEEDTDEIELIEIECGQNGKPLLIIFPETRAECYKAMAILKKTAGEGNFDIMEGFGFF